MDYYSEEQFQEYEIQRQQEILDYYESQHLKETEEKKKLQSSSLIGKKQANQSLNFQFFALAQLNKKEDKCTLCLSFQNFHKNAVFPFKRQSINTIDINQNIQKFQLFTLNLSAQECTQKQYELYFSKSESSYVFFKTKNSYVESGNKARQIQQECDQQYIFNLDIDQQYKKQIGKFITDPLLQLSVYLQFLGQKTELNIQELYILFSQFKQQCQSIQIINGQALDIFLRSFQILEKFQLQKEQLNVFLLTVLGLIFQSYQSLQILVEKTIQTKFFDLDIDFLVAQMNNESNHSYYKEIKQGILLLLRLDLEMGGTNFMILLSKEQDQQVKKSLYQNILNQINQNQIEKLEDQQLIALKTQIQDDFYISKQKETVLSFLEAFNKFESFTQALRIFADIFKVQNEQFNSHISEESLEKLQSEQDKKIINVLNQKLTNLQISLE